MIDPYTAPDKFRPCVGILLLNRADGIFVGERLDAPDAWQMPQGGIDRGESVIDAAVRELFEETGIKNVRPLGVDDEWRTYTLPREISRSAWGGEFLGQAQVWTAFRFTGDDSEINIKTAHAEFARWKWTDPDNLIREIIDFKRDIYRDVLAAYPSWTI